MRVIHVYKDYPPVLGGIESHLRLLAEAQAARGLDVTVLVTAPGPRTTVNLEGGVEVVRAARLVTVASTPLSLALPHELRRRRADVTHLHFPYPLGELAQLVCGPRSALVITYHSDIIRQKWLGRLYRPLMWRILRRADRILPTSSAYRDSSPVLRRLRERTTVVPLGIDTRRFAAIEPRRVAVLRQRWSAPLVLFVGRLRYYKGVDVLIDAMSSVAATLLIIGTGPMEKTWRQRAASSAAAERIHFLGEIADLSLPTYLAAADVFVLPSTHRSEAYGLAQAEAMAAGTPVISTELETGTSRVNRDGETGRVVAAGDAGLLATALRELLDDDDKRQRLGRQARARAEQQLGFERMVDRVEAVYREVLAR